MELGYLRKIIFDREMVQEIMIENIVDEFKFLLVLLFKFYFFFDICFKI